MKPLSGPTKWIAAVVAAGSFAPLQEALAKNGDGKPVPSITWDKRSIPTGIRVSFTRRFLQVVAPPGERYKIRGRCPRDFRVDPRVIDPKTTPKTSWGANTAPTQIIPEATGEGFDIEVEAPWVPGDTNFTEATCKKGKTETTHSIMTIAGIPPPAPPEPNGESEVSVYFGDSLPQPTPPEPVSSPKGRNLTVMPGLRFGVAFPAGIGSSLTAGPEVAGEVRFPLRNSAHAVGPSAIYSSAVTPETINTATDTQEQVERQEHCLMAGASYIRKFTDWLRGRVSVVLGVCWRQKQATRKGLELEPLTGFGIREEAGVELGRPSLGVRAGFHLQESAGLPAPFSLGADLGLYISTNSL